MKVFNNLNLKTKILSGFFIVAIIATIVGIIGVVKIDKVSNKDEQLYKKMTVPMNNLYNTTEAYQRMRGNLRDVILSSTPAEYADYESRINDRRNTVNKNIDEFEKTLLTDAGKQAVADLRSSLTDYQKVESQVISLAEQNKDQEALALLRSDGETAKTKVESNLAKLSDIKIKLAKKAADTNSDTASNAKVLMIIFIIVAALVAVALGVIVALSITKPINQLVEYADRLSLGDVNIEIKNNSKDEIGVLMVSFKKMIENIKENAIAAEKISKGDLDFNIKPKSEEDILAKSMILVIETLDNLEQEADKLTTAAIEGRLSVRGDEKRFEGGYKQIIQGVNKTLDAVVGPLNVAADYVDKISKGNMPPKISDTYNGDFNIIKNNLNECIGNINNLVADANMLSQAAIEGRLSNRADASKHSGDYRLIVEGVNSTLDSVIGPLNVAADYVYKISKGDIPSKIVDSYNGDFNIIKNNLNTCIDNVNSLVKDVNMLSQAAIDGKLDVRADAEKHSGDFRKIVEGINLTLDGIIEPISESRKVLSLYAKNDLTCKMSGSYNGVMKEFAKDINSVHERLSSIVRLVKEASVGDTNSIENLSQIGRRCENDELLPSLLLMMVNIRNVVNESSKIADSAVKGDLDARSDVSKFQGGFREILEGFNKALDAMEEPIKEAESVLKEMSEGNLCSSMEGIYQGSYKVIKDSLNNTLNSFNDLLGSITEASEQVFSGANQVSDGSQALSQGTTEQASAIEELTSSISEVAAQTKQNAINASQANELALNAKDGATLGNSHMKEMLKSMDAINESSTNISKIIKVIDDIAFQTNILALNAAVEAARAGQHGKGFAVVAEEVRNLAARSANAAKETTDLIEGSIKKVESGTRIANNTAEALDQIVEGVSKAATLVGEIAVASNEQATAISQINKGVEQVSDVVQTNSATAQQSAAASEELSSQASMLKSMVEKFKLKRGNSISNSIRESLSDDSSKYSVKTESKNKPQIYLSDNDFGKY